jgi:hypothetical protein
MVCCVEGCDNLVVVKTPKLCGKHYQRKRVHGDVNHTSFYAVNPTIQPLHEEILWAAGFLEGEGCFQSHTNSMRASANQVQKWPLEKLHAWFGGSLRLQKHPDWRSDIWVWIVYGARAQKVMTLVYPHMSPKRQEQICKALQTKTKEEIRNG